MFAIYNHGSAVVLAINTNKLACCLKTLYLPTVVVESAMTNYSNVHGVGYSRFTPDESEPEVEQRDAKVEELYYDEDMGEICIRMRTDDGLLSFSIPIFARLDFNEFKYSLPEIDA